MSVTRTHGAGSVAVRLLFVVGTRPNFMKVAPVMAAVESWNVKQEPGPEAVRFEQRLIHTGQHYDAAMSSVFFEELGLRAPDSYLDVGSGSHAVQTAALMVALEPHMIRERPDLVVVVGDVNSTLAAALVAAKLGLAVAHVEAGLRSGDRDMPEEINRMVTDRVSRLLLATSAEAAQRLQSEGVPEDWSFIVGNAMIDCLETVLPHARARAMAAELGLRSRGFALVTLHRPSNVDDIGQMSRLAKVVSALAERVPVVFPVHARTTSRLEAAGWLSVLSENPSVRLLPPLGYIDFLSLMADARVVVTDSGGIQAETCVLGTPCVTARTTTEWTETIRAGLNNLADPRDPQAVLDEADRVLGLQLPPRGTRPPFWDGHAAERIVDVIADWAAQQRARR
jgi:UDP-N-acetylglucosamine 2-epimerase (non-hydrolysing)